MLPGPLLLLSSVALLLFLSSLWLPQGGGGDCGAAWHPCLSFYHNTPEHQVVLHHWAEPTVAPPLQDCPGQAFQARHLLRHLRASVMEDGDVLLQPYLQSWRELIKFMESLGTVVSFFSQKVKTKVSLIEELSRKAGWKEACRSLRSMVRAELEAGLVNFSHRTGSGCRTVLRLHRSLLWLKLILQGLAEGAGENGRSKTPAQLSREAYRVVLAPHHSWVLRQAAELVFLALPDREFFFRLVCVSNQQEATPKLRIIIHALEVVQARTQHILQEHDMLELP